MRVTSNQFSWRHPRISMIFFYPFCCLMEWSTVCWTLSLSGDDLTCNLWDGQRAFNNNQSQRNGTSKQSAKNSQKAYTAFVRIHTILTSHCFYFISFLPFKLYVTFVRTLCYQSTTNLRGVRNMAKKKKHKNNWNKFYSVEWRSRMNCRDLSAVCCVNAFVCLFFSLALCRK